MSATSRRSDGSKSEYLMFICGTKGSDAQPIIPLEYFRQPVKSNFSRHEREKACLKSDQPVSTATSHCRRNQLRRVSVHMNVHSVPLVSTPSWATSVPIAVEVLYPDQSDHRRIGKAITILARTQQVPRSNINPWPLKFMRGSRPKSNQYRQRSGNPQHWTRLTTPSTRT